MIICLDGIDGAGKSTLADALAHEIKMRFPNDVVRKLHASQPKADAYTEYYKPFEDYVPGGNVHYILDRWFLGEEIYGVLYRGKSIFTSAMFRWTDLALATLGFRLWNVTAPLETIQKRLDTRGEDFLQPEHVELVHKLYLTKTKTMATFAKNIEPLENDSELIDVIIKDAMYAESMAVIYAESPVNYLGPTFASPRTVLVVDNTKENHMFSPLISLDAEYIYTSLTSDMTSSFAVISANNVEKLNEFLCDDIPYANVVAFSKYAKNKLNHIGIAHGDLDIPVPSIEYGITLKHKAEESGKING